MLNRRHLRLKALQGVYMYLVSDDKNNRKIELDLLRSAEKINDLHHQILSLFIEILHQARLQIDRNKQKRLPTHEDLHPNLAFVQNPILLAIESNRLLKISCETKKINWMNEQELMRKLYKTFEETTSYKEYMDYPEKHSFQDDRAIVLSFFEEIIVPSEIIEQNIEDKSIFWHDDLLFVYTKIYQSIEKWTEASTERDLVFTEVFKDEDDKEFLLTLYRRTIENLHDYEELIQKKADNWEFDRIALIDRILILLGITEIIHFPSIPIKVSLNEYIDLAKEYSTDKSNVFINGLLDKIVADLTKSGKISKTGRGLMERN